MSFYIGCAVWAYKDWVGDFYPAGSRAGDFLKLYSQRFTTVEGNTTFYSVPDKETVKRWAAETSPNFKFCLKLPKYITHQGLLQPNLPAALKFLEQMQELGDKLGPLFAQLPPGYSPNALDDLLAFLNGWLTSGMPIALEVRHPDWFKATHARELNQHLQEMGVGRVLMDTRPIYDAPDDPQVESERRKPNVPLQPVVTAPFSLIRFISHPDRDFNQPYLQEWSEQVDQWLREGTEIYFFAHCPDERRSPHIARNFQSLLEQYHASVPPLPWNGLKDDEDASPAQLSLF